MTQYNDNTPNKKHTHLTKDERSQIEILKRDGHSNRESAVKIERAPQTINNEINRGTVPQKQKQVQKGKAYHYIKDAYFADVGQRRYEENRIHSKRQPKWVNIPAFLDYADEKMLNDSWSPDVVIGTSIEERPKHIQDRTAFGHWEIDTVQGIQGADDTVLLTLVESKTRLEVIIKIDGKDADSVSRAMRALADKAGTDMASIFKTIISDNGSEFSTLETDLKATTSVYFCHPYASYERGSSENQHKFIRRHMPKGQSLRNVSESHVLRTQQWMNTYPRKILNYQTPREAFKNELKRII